MQVCIIYIHTYIKICIKNQMHSYVQTINIYFFIKIFITPINQYIPLSKFCVIWYVCILCIVKHDNMYLIVGIGLKKWHPKFWHVQIHLRVGFTQKSIKMHWYDYNIVPLLNIAKSQIFHLVAI